MKKSYKVTYDLDQLVSATSIKAAQEGIIAFLTYAKTLDSSVKDEVVNQMFLDDNQIVKNFDTIQVLLNDFLRLKK